MIFRASSRRPVLLPAWRRLFLVALVAGSGLVARVAADELPISLPEDVLPDLGAILDRASSLAPNVQLANLELARAEATYLIHRASMLPTLSAFGSYSVSTSRREDQPMSQSDSDG